MSKKALAVISFGTTYPKARSAIELLEKKIAIARPDYHFHRAFTSNIVIQKIARQEGICIPTPAQLMQSLEQQGYEEVVCQSLHIIPAIEYEKMCTQIYQNAGKMHVTIGQPLLSSPQDYFQVCKILLKQMPILKEDEAFVYMGHGTEHIMNAVYSQLENTFRYFGAERIYVGTVEGFPDLDYVKKRLEFHKVRKIWLAPFMIVAGDHAQNDLAGDHPQSWKSQLQAYQVEVCMKGLGEIAGIDDIFISHCMKN